MAKEKAILRIVHPNQSEQTNTYDDLYEDLLRPGMRVESRAQVETALKHPERYRGVFLETLMVRTGATRASKLDLYNMGNGIDIVNMAKEKGLPVIVMSEATEMHDPDIIKLIQNADAVFEKPFRNTDKVREAMRNYFV